MLWTDTAFDYKCIQFEWSFFWNVAVDETVPPFQEVPYDIGRTFINGDT